MKGFRPGRFSKTLLFAVVLGAASLDSALAQSAKGGADTGFSFDVYGDSRSMMYLPYKQSQEADARKLMVDMFELVMPEKMSEAVVQRDVKLVYDPSTHELVQLVMPFMTRSEVTTLTLDKGWVTSASVEDVKLLPGVRREMFRLDGGQWVAREVVRDIKAGNAKFVVNTGDLVWWGRQGDKPSDNPYWSLVEKDVLKELPPADAEMKKAGLDGVVFPAVGNHEVWDDSDVEGLLASFPYLTKLGVSKKQLIYKFDFRGVRFIFLYTGPYDYRQPSGWDAQQPAYDAQMVQLKKWLDEAKATGIKKIFVSFHAPVYCRSGMGPIPEAQNPHKTLESYAKDLDIVVFNGHVHTTELFQAGGVKYFVVGGGGAEQDPILPGRTAIKTLPADYPRDVYWKGAPPVEEYNFLHVDVKPGQATKFTIHRFRPGSAEPYASVEVFQ
ncbi:MAG TPA: metallophosphoesterase [Thermoanaerobaculia bacterium]|nr:metallophosphoesterase [Thermoanaerobaculia bacterium]